MIFSSSLHTFTSAIVHPSRRQFSFEEISLAIGYSVAQLMQRNFPTGFEHALSAFNTYCTYLAVCLKMEVRNGILFCSFMMILFQAPNGF
jgi:hypothetical protein